MVSLKQKKIAKSSKKKVHAICKKASKKLARPVRSMLKKVGVKLTPKEAKVESKKIKKLHCKRRHHKVASKKVVHRSKKVVRHSHRPKKGVIPKALRPWMSHVKSFRKSHPKLSYKKALHAAKPSFHKKH